MRRSSLRSHGRNPPRLKSFLSSLLSPEPLGAAPAILVLQLRRIGELVLTTPALAILRNTWPSARITLVVSQGCLELAPTLPRMDEVLAFQPALSSNRALFRRLLTGHFDVCLDFSGTDRSALFSLLSRARRTIAFEWARKGPLRRLIYQSFVQVALSSQHTLDQMLELLRPVGMQVPAGASPPVLSVPPIAVRRVQLLFRECGIGGDFALIHPGSAAPEKFWLPERWAEAILHLQHVHGLPCILTGGSDPDEQNHLRAIQTALAMLGSGPLPLPLVVLAGNLDLTMLTAIAARCRLAVSCDTALMHIVSAFERPQISLFGPTNPFHWRPRHRFSRILRAADPSAAAESFSPDAPTAPMSEIPSASLCREIDALMRETTNSHPVPSTTATDSGAAAATDSGAAENHPA